MVLSKKQGPKRARSRERHTMYQRRPPNSSGSDVMDEKDAVGVVTVTQALLFFGISSGTSCWRTQADSYEERWEES